MPTATSRFDPLSKGGRDGRCGFRGGTFGTYSTASRSGVNLPNEDVGATITIEQYRREGRA